MISDVPRITIQSWNEPFSESSVPQFEKVFAEYIANQRWYRAKAHRIERLSIVDAVPLSATDLITVIEIQYPDGTSASTYLVPLSVREISKSPPTQSEIIAHLRNSVGEQRILTSALSEADFRDTLLKAVACEATFQSRHGRLIASHTRALSYLCGGALPRVDSAVSRAEQSNTSIIYGDRFILKLFRKVEPGINPDIEVGTFLTNRGFKHTPAVLGCIEYRDQSSVYAAAILQQFVRNQGDAWKYTLDSLGSFFETVLPLGERPDLFDLANQHPIVLMDQSVPPEARRLLSTYLDSVELLGKRTAQMHASLMGSNDTDFAPEPVTPQIRRQIYDEVVAQANIAFEGLRQKQAELSGATGAAAREVLHRESEIIQRFSDLHDMPITTVRIRYHGDYHLGQVLFTGEDFMIIDFEGEPARPLSDRRSKGLAMRDVAGMIRSFQYAAYAALFGGVRGIPEDPANLPLVEHWAAFWNAFVGAAYLRAYFAEAQNSPFVPSSTEERRLLLDACILQKALYEISYELNNRPDWVRIPLRGILNLTA